MNRRRPGRATARGAGARAGTAVAGAAGAVVAGAAGAAAARFVAAGVALVIAVAEVHAWSASRSRYPRTPETGTDDARDVVLVLGYRSREDGRINALQAWRVRIALRSAPPGALFVFSGAAVHGLRPEADVMADYAAARGVPATDIVRERAARSTRENISCSLPWLREARTIRIASNTFHARRARGYLRELAPELHARLRPTRDFRPLELGPLRVALTVYDAVASLGAARATRAARAARADRRFRRPPVPLAGETRPFGARAVPGGRSSL